MPQTTIAKSRQWTCTEQCKNLAMARRQTECPTTTSQISWASCVTSIKKSLWSMWLVIQSAQAGSTRSTLSVTIA
eukprot:symbB.v1.2.018859.t1/scaffold1520.1/size114066/5